MILLFKARSITELYSEFTILKHDLKTSTSKWNFGLPSWCSRVLRTSGMFMQRMLVAVCLCFGAAQQFRNVCKKTRCLLRSRALTIFVYTINVKTLQCYTLKKLKLITNIKHTVRHNVFRFWLNHLQGASGTSKTSSTWNMLELKCILYYSLILIF